MMRLATGCISVCVACALSGCIGSRMDIVAARCEPVQGRTGPDAVGFDAQVATQGYSGQQFVYRVELYDAFGSPIRSRNNRFRNASGGVAASRTFVPLEGAPPVQIMRVTIPMSEMELSAPNPPTQALFGLYQIDGVCLARQTVALPQIGPKASAPGEALAAAPPPQDDQPSAELGNQVDSQLDDRAESQPEGLAAATPDRDPDPYRGPSRDAETESDSTEPPPDAMAAATDPAASDSDAAEVAVHADDAHMRPETDRLASAAKETPPATPAPLPEDSSDDVPHYVSGIGETPVDPSRPAVASTEPSAEGTRSIEGTRVHVIEAGDSMRSISLKYYSVHDGIDHILQANPGFNPRRARIGRRLIIPPFVSPPRADEDRADRDAQGAVGGGEAVTAEPPADTSDLQRYIVRRGDTLTGVARRFLGDALRWREVYELNQEVIQDADELRIGMVLIIPER